MTLGPITYQRAKDNDGLFIWIHKSSSGLVIECPAHYATAPCSRVFHPKCKQVLLELAKFTVIKVDKVADRHPLAYTKTLLVDFTFTFSGRKEIFNWHYILC